MTRCVQVARCTCLEEPQSSIWQPTQCWHEEILRQETLPLDRTVCRSNFQGQYITYSILTL